MKLFAGIAVGRMEAYKEQASMLWDDVQDTNGFDFVKMYSSRFWTGLTYALPVFGAAIQQRQADSRRGCPGYRAENVQTTASGLTADLTLAGTACDVFGRDIGDLRLLVNYDSGIYSLVL